MKKAFEYKSWIKNYLLPIVFTFVLSVSAAGWNGYILPTFKKDTKTNVTAYVGKTAVLPCSIINLGTKKVVWKKTDQKHALTIGDFVFTSDKSHSVDHTQKSNKWNLVIKNVQKSHAGLYECQVSTKEDLFRRVRLNVIDPPPIDETKELEKKLYRPAIHISGPNFTEKGEPIRISCNATSDTMTPARMDWFRDGIKIKQNADAGIFIHEYTIRESKSLYSELEIKKSTMKDAGTYICRSSRTDVVSHYVVVLNADSNHDKRGFQDKKIEKSSHFNNDPGNSASMINKRVHYLISSCLLIFLIILSHNR